MTAQVIGDVADPTSLAVVGVVSRGAMLAMRMRDLIEAQTGVRPPAPRSTSTAAILRCARWTESKVSSVDGRTIVLVDDVINSGWTVQRAMTALWQRARPAAVKLAVLIDRGHRALPIRPNYVGKSIPTARADRVQVRLGRAGCRRAQSGRPRRAVLDGRIAQGDGAPAMRPLLLTGGRVIDPQYQVDGARDVLVIDGEIDALEPRGSLQAPEGAEVLDCAGLWIVAGLIDPHVHLRDPGFPEKETILTGLRAAAAGGFTTVAAMANTSPVDDTPEVARYMIERARAAHAARLIPVSAVTRGLAGRDLVGFNAMADAGARLFSDDGIPIDDPVVLYAAFRRRAARFRNFAA